ncbi:MAG: COX15/CtaA family protein [Bacillota bacterium]
MGLQIEERKRPAAPFRLALAVAILSLAVVVFGVVVRVSGSGLGCPDWPLCYGSVVPPAVGAAIIEFTHRLVAGLFMAGVYWLAIVAWRGRAAAPAASWEGQARRALAVISLSAAVVVTFQAVLGGLNVLTELSPGVGGAHVVTATIVVALQASALVLARSAGALPPPLQAQAGRTGTWRLALWTSVAALVVAGLGGYVRATGASLACTDWPLCGGSLLPREGWPFVLQWSHRAAAAVLGVLVLAGAVRAGGVWWLAAALYATQVGLGALNVVWMVPA